MNQETETSSTTVESDSDLSDSANAGPWQGIFKWLCKVLVIERKNTKSLVQFTSSLRAEVEILSKSAFHADGSDHEAILAEINVQQNEIDSDINSPDNWNSAYYIEQLVTALYGYSRIPIELERRVQEAVNQNAPFTEFYLEKLASVNERNIESSLQSNSNLTGNTSQQTEIVQHRDEERQLLLSLVKDLQWFYQQQNLKQQFSRDAMYRVFIVFIASFSILLLALWFSIAAPAAIVTGQQ